jgi:hypothetical protein
LIIVVFTPSSLLHWAAKLFVRELSLLTKDGREELVHLLARNEPPAPARLQASDQATVAGVCIGTELDDKDAPVEECKRYCRASAMPPAYES